MQGIITVIGILLVVLLVRILTHYAIVKGQKHREIIENIRKREKIIPLNQPK